MARRAVNKSYASYRDLINPPKNALRTKEGPVRPILWKSKGPISLAPALHSNKTNDESYVAPKGS